jgi:hypothetical protein
MTSCAGLSCGPGEAGDYPAPGWAKYVITPVVFVGAMAGMIGLGFLADVLGRLDPAGGIPDTGDGTGRHANKDKK